MIAFASDKRFGLFGIGHGETEENTIVQRFSTAGPRPGTGPWHQLYLAARDSPGIDNYLKCNLYICQHTTPYT